MARTSTRRPLLRWLIMAATALAAIGVVGGAAGAIGHAILQARAEVTSQAVTQHTPADGDFAVWGTAADGSPYQWNPCQPIRLVMNDDGAPDGWRDDFTAAINAIESVAPDTFAVVGTTSEHPDPQRAPYQPDRYGNQWAPVLVAWSPSSSFPLLRAHDRGVALPVAVGGSHDREFVSGQVVFHADRDLVIGGSDRADAWRATFLHELLHLIGLDHVDDPDAIMYHYPGQGPIVLNAADRAGISALRSGRCLDTPEPTTIDVITQDPAAP